MRHLLIIAGTLLFAACEDRSESPQGKAQDARRIGSADVSGGRGAKSGRAETQEAMGGGHLRRIEKALESSEHETALTGFRELLEFRKQLAAEALLASRHKDTANSSEGSGASGMEMRLQVLDQRVGEALFALRQHDVDPAAVDRAVRDYRDEASRNSAIHELEGIDDVRHAPWQTDPSQGTPP